MCYVPAVQRGLFPRICFASSWGPGSLSSRAERLPLPFKNRSSQYVLERHLYDTSVTSGFLKPLFCQKAFYVTFQQLSCRNIQERIMPIPPVKGLMPVWRRPGLLRQNSPGVPSDVMVCLRVLARTGRVDCRRPCASFTPSSGSTAMSILCVARWRSARSMIEWMCTQERWNPEVAIIFGAAARYRRATVGSSHDDAHLDTSALHTGAVCPHTGFV